MRPQTRTKRDTKERILAVATELFASKGYSGTSVRDIANEAQANLAAINYHFQRRRSGRLLSILFFRSQAPHVSGPGMVQKCKVAGITAVQALGGQESFVVLVLAGKVTPWPLALFSGSVRNARYFHGVLLGPWQKFGVGRET